MESPAPRVNEPVPQLTPSFLTEPDRTFSSADAVDLRQLVSHALSVDASAKIEEVSRAFAEASVEFLAVLEAGKLTGMCSRHELGDLLGSRYGFSLWARDPIRDHLRKNEIRIAAGDAIAAVLATVFAKR